MSEDGAEMRAEEGMAEGKDTVADAENGESHRLVNRY